VNNTATEQLWKTVWKKFRPGYVCQAESQAELGY